MCSVTLFLLSLAALHSVNIGFLERLFSQQYILAWMIIAMLALILPILFIVAGHHVLSEGIQWIEDHLTKVGEDTVEAATSAVAQAEEAVKTTTN